MEARIVVIDNDAGVRDMFTYCLRRKGWQVFGYSYAEVDLMAIDQYRPHLIILDFDIRDGGGIGWNFLQLLKMEDATARIPILVSTTEFDLSSEIRAYLLTRYIGIIHKPLDLDTFLPLIQKTLTLASQADTLLSRDPTLPILVVDDRDDLRESITMILRFERYRVVTACNGRIALDSVSRADHCLILLDIAMPVMNGIEFLAAYDQQLRPHSPVVIQTAETDLRGRHLPSFVVDVMAKPFEVRDLLKVVGKYAQPL